MRLFLLGAYVFASITLFQLIQYFFNIFPREFLSDLYPFITYAIPISAIIAGFLVWTDARSKNMTIIPGLVVGVSGFLFPGLPLLFVAIYHLISFLSPDFLVLLNNKKLNYALVSIIFFVAGIFGFFLAMIFSLFTGIAGINTGGIGVVERVLPILYFSVPILLLIIGYNIFRKHSFPKKLMMYLSIPFMLTVLIMIFEEGFIGGILTAPLILSPLAVAFLFYLYIKKL